MSFIEWGDDEEDWEAEEPDDPVELTVDIVDPQVIATLYGPDGEPLRYLLDRPTVPFGFQRPASPDDPPPPVTVQP